jgi:hypothetical protein
LLRDLLLDVYKDLNGRVVGQTVSI